LDALLKGSFQWKDLRNEMNKTELIDKLASVLEVSKAEAGRSLNALLDVITESLGKGEEVALVGFGTFKVVPRKARTGRNPQTGATIKIPAQKSPRFSAGKQLKEACNKGKK
jgi:DNA-binding protein HU-beta